MGTNEPIRKEFMSSIGDRLREERDALGMNQSDFAAAAGTTRKSQFNYETDARRPDADYLAAIASLGTDVLYILTGKRSQPIAPTVKLAPRQRALLDNYEHSDEVGKKVIEGAAVLAAQSKGKKAARGGERAA